MITFLGPLLGLFFGFIVLIVLDSAPHAMGVRLTVIRAGFLSMWRGPCSVWRKRKLVTALQPIRRLGIRSIVLHQAERGPRVREPTKDRALHVHLGAAPGPSSKRPLPCLVLGQVAPPGDYLLQPSGRGISVEDENMIVVAELVEQHIYVLFDPFSGGDQRGYDTLALVLEAAAESIEVLRATPLAAQTTVRAALQTKTRDAFVAHSLRGLESQRASAARAVEATQSRITQLLAEQTDEVRALRELQLARDLERALQRPGEPRLVVELDAIRALPEVTAAYFDGTRIVLLTKPIAFTDPSSRKSSIPCRYRIVIYPDGSHGGVRWFNLQHEADGLLPDMQAPMVYPTGQALMGPTQTLFPPMLGREEFAKVAGLALRSLRTIQASDVAASFVGAWVEA